MNTIGVRELRDHLSEHLRRLRTDRQPLTVTDRGEAVAVLMPVPESGGATVPPCGVIAPSPPMRVAPLADRVRHHGGRLPTSTAPLPPSPIGVAELDVLALLDGLREGR
jgi:prevent-host-death family protein